MKATIRWGGLLLPALWLCTLPLLAQAVKVEVRNENGAFRLYRGGQPFYIRGAGGDRYLDRLAQYGGNSIRTWGTDDNTQTLLDAAQAQGITVCMGLWVGHERHGFDYNNADAVARQLADFRRLVLRYKDHPAVLLWGIGNEVDLSYTNHKVWDAINDIAAMVHELDPDHPTMTVLAGANANNIRLIAARAPQIDLLGVNSYAGLPGVPNGITQAGWNKPYLITEFGPSGPWEVAKTTWGAALEQTSSEKADAYKSRYEAVMGTDVARCLGSYVFLWGDKQELTPTWFSLFTKNGAETEVVDVMHYLWKGVYPANRTPRLGSLTVNGKRAGDNVVIVAEEGNTATVTVADPESDALQYEWIFLPEGEAGVGGDPQASLPSIPGLIQSASGNTVTFRTPGQKGNYRVYAFVHDGNGNVAIANVPFQADPRPLVSSDPNILFASQDAYVRDGDYAGRALGKEDPLNLGSRQQANESFNRETFLGFRLNTIGKEILKAELLVFGGGYTDVPVAAYPVADTLWDENTIRWGTRPATSAGPLDTIRTFGDKQDRYYAWNVTAYVNQEKTLGRNAVTLALKNVGPSPEPITWFARERRENPPKLVFTLGEKPIVLSTERAPGVAFGLYPNPASGKLVLKAAAPVEEVVLYHVTGGRRLRFGNLPAVAELDVRGLPPGVYLVTVRTRQHTHYRKVLIR